DDAKRATAVASPRAGHRDALGGRAAGERHVAQRYLVVVPRDERRRGGLDQSPRRAAERESQILKPRFPMVRVYHRVSVNGPASALGVFELSAQRDAPVG